MSSISVANHKEKRPSFDGRFFFPLAAKLRPPVADVRAEAAFALAKLADCAYRRRRYLAMRGDVSSLS